MTLRALAKCALLSFHILRIVASPVGISATDELVRTPGGLMLKSNVHLVPEGGAVVHTPTAIQLVDADGTVLHSDPLTNSTSVFPPRNASGTPNSKARRALNSGWVSWVSWGVSSGPAISYFTTTWSVPPAPVNWDDQLIYIFNGLQPFSGDAILQPVLQYGYSDAGGGAYWSIASWYVFSSGAAYYTSSIAVQPGQVLTGVITNTDSSTSGLTTSYLWYAYFVVDNDLNRSTVLSVTTTEVLNWAYETLEIYDVSTAADLPAGTTPMSGIQIYTGDSQPSTLDWGLRSDPVDGISVEVISTSSSNGEVQIKYPTS